MKELKKFEEKKKKKEEDEKKLMEKLRAEGKLKPKEEEKVEPLPKGLR